MSHEKISIACVQARVTLADFFTEQSFRTLTERLMEQAMAAMPANTPRLVVFPEDYASGCIFAGEEDALKDSSSLRGAVATLVRRHFTGVMGQRLRHRVGWVRALALHRASAVAQLYFETFSTVARTHNAYVLGGSVLLPELVAADGRMEPRGGHVYNVSFLFGPDGQVVGSQRKAFLIDLEGSEALDLSPGDVDDLSVIETELGRIGIAICFDAFQAPVIERLGGMDVDILLQPSANPEPWSERQQEDWLNGAWKAVAERGIAIYGVNPMLVGNLLDIQFEGQSSIVCKDTERLAEDYTENLGRLGYDQISPRPGFVKVARTWTDAEVLSVTVPHPATLK